MSFFAGLIHPSADSEAQLSAAASPLWAELTPHSSFEETTLRGTTHAVRMAALPSEAQQSSLVEIRDPQAPEQIGFALFSGYLLNRAELLAQVQKRQAGAWLTGGETSNAAVMAAITAEIVTGDPARPDYALLRQSNGLFAFAIWLPTRQKLILGVDRYGIHPLHFVTRDGQIGFSSELAPLTTLTDTSALVGSAIDDLVSCRFILGDVTQLRGVERVPPGELVVLSPSARTHLNYWDVSNWPLREDLSAQDYIDGQISALHTAVTRSLAIVPKPLVLLSGGNDSRRILLEMIRQGVRPECWTAMQFNAKLPVETDSCIAQALSRNFDLPHRIIPPLDPDQEDRWARFCRTLMEYDTAQHYWLLPLLKELPFDAGWNFDGYGGDFYVYDTFLSPETTLAVPNHDAIVSAARRHLAGNVTDLFVRMQAATPIEARIRDILRAMPQNENTYSQFMANVWSRRRTSHMSQRLLKHKMPTVFPYLDNDLVSFSFSYPPACKINRNFQREILLQEYPELMRTIPTLNDITAAGPGSALWQSHTRPLPPALDLRRKVALSRTGVRVIRERIPLPELTPRTRQVAQMFSLATTFGLARQVAMRSFWRLEPIGFLGEMMRFYQEPTRRRGMLAEARQFIYQQ